MCRESSFIRNVGITHTTTTATILLNKTNSIDTNTDLYKTTIENILNQSLPESNILSTITPVIDNVASTIISNATSLVESIGNNITEPLSLVLSPFSEEADFIIKTQPNSHNKLNTLHNESAISHFMR